MARRDEGDKPPDLPEGGKAATRPRQFLQARGLEEPASEQDDDSGEAGRDAGTHEDRDEDSGG